MGNTGSNTESVFEALSSNGAGMSVCSNDFTVCGVFPEGTLKGTSNESFGVFFYVRIPATSLSEIVNTCTFSKLETTRFQRFAIFRNHPNKSSLHLMDIVPDRFEHIHLRIYIQTDILFECGQVFMTTKRHYYPFT